MKLPISGTEFAYDGLDCPACGGNYLHHEGIMYYNRNEDSETGDLVSLQEIFDNDKLNFISSHVTNAEMKRCPSPRRGGMDIIFSCECCSAKPKLSIYQHKGQTFIEWTRIKDLSELAKAALDMLPKERRRQPIKPSLRFEILKRDDYRCQMCGTTAKEGATLEIDHIHPVAKGGSNDPGNLQVLCRDCNAGKGAQSQ